MMTLGWLPSAAMLLPNLLPPQFSPNFAPSLLCHELDTTSSKAGYTKFAVSSAATPTPHFLSVIMSMALQIKRLMTVPDWLKVTREVEC